MATHGNYKGYQGISRHDGLNPASHVVDLRIKLLASQFPSLFPGKEIYDIGCNNGAVAAHVAMNYSPRTVTGIDIDADLVKKAKSHLSFQYSRTAPDGSDVNYFPISSVMAHGHRPYPLEDAAFPRNVRFVCADFMNAPLEAEKFDVVLALSVVKWIHLQNGDEGLKSFFHKVHSTLKPSGHFVLEPQDWDSYKKAVKKNRGMKPNFEALTLKPESFGSLADEAGFVYECVIDEGLRRGIWIYTKR